MTASGGITTNNYITGNNNGGTAMPADTSTTAPTTLTNSAYNNNIQIDTLIATFPGAQFVVLMLGTNDMRQGHPLQWPNPTSDRNRLPPARAKAAS